METYKNHRIMKSQLKQIYDTSVLNLNGGECIINIDFKQNVSVNQCSDELGHDWYGKPQRTVFGVTITYKKNGQIEFFYFDVVSDVLNHISAFVITALKKFFQIHFLKVLIL